MPFRRASSSCHLFLPFYDCRFIVLHSANITDLVPGQSYRYRIFSFSETENNGVPVDYSEVFEFHYPKNYHLDSKSVSTAKKPSDDDIQRFLVFSDIAVDDNGGVIDSLIKEAKENAPVDMMITMGDYAYDTMTPKGTIDPASAGVAFSHAHSTPFFFYKNTFFFAQAGCSYFFGDLSLKCSYQRS